MKINQDYYKSLFSVFLLGAVIFAILGISIVFLRQKIASHAIHIRSLERELQEIDTQTLSLASHIAQLETPLYLQFQAKRNYRFPSPDQVIHVRNWPYASRMASAERDYISSVAMALPRSNGKAL
jgi:cell division protein FtsB